MACCWDVFAGLRRLCRPGLALLFNSNNVPSPAADGPDKLEEPPESEKELDDSQMSTDLDELESDGELDEPEDAPEPDLQWPEDIRHLREEARRDATVMHCCGHENCGNSCHLQCALTMAAVVPALLRKATGMWRYGIELSREAVVPQWLMRELEGALGTRGQQEDASLVLEKLLSWFGDTLGLETRVCAAPGSQIQPTAELASGPPGTTLEYLWRSIPPPPGDYNASFEDLLPVICPVQDVKTVVAGSEVTIAEGLRVQQRVDGIPPPKLLAVVLHRWHNGEKNASKVRAPYDLCVPLLPPGFTQLELGPTAPWEKFHYKLAAYSCHLGESLQNGHYTCYYRAGLSDQWHLVNDHACSAVDAATARRACDEGYIYLYQFHGVWQGQAAQDVVNPITDIQLSSNWRMQLLQLLQRAPSVKVTITEIDLHGVSRNFSVTLGKPFQREKRGKFWKLQKVLGEMDQAMDKARAFGNKRFQNMGQLGNTVLDMDQVINDLRQGNPVAGLSFETVQRALLALRSKLEKRRQAATATVLEVPIELQRQLEELDRCMERVQSLPSITTSQSAAGQSSADVPDQSSGATAGTPCSAPLAPPTATSLMPRARPSSPSNSGASGSTGLVCIAPGTYHLEHLTLEAIDRVFGALCARNSRLQSRVVTVDVLVEDGDDDEEGATGEAGGVTVFRGVQTFVTPDEPPDEEHRPRNFRKQQKRKERHAQRVAKYTRPTH